MDVVLTGIVLGFAVSIPPGPNTVLCVNLASAGGIRRAAPLITTAALTDAAYSLLAASGLLLASQTGSAMLSFLGPCFMIAAAALTWPSAQISPMATAGTTLLNPGTAIIWLGLSSVPALHVVSSGGLLVRTMPVAIGTATWFTLLAITASKLSNRVGPGPTLAIQRALSVTLAAGGVASLAMLAI